MFCIFFILYRPAFWSGAMALRLGETGPRVEPVWSSVSACKKVHWEGGSTAPALRGNPPLGALSIFRVAESEGWENHRPQRPGAAGLGACFRGWPTGSKTSRRWQGGVWRRRRRRRAKFILGNQKGFGGVATKEWGWVPVFVSMTHMLVVSGLDGPRGPLCCGVGLTIRLNGVIVWEMIRKLKGIRNILQGWGGGGRTWW